MQSVKPPISLELVLHDEITEPEAFVEIYRGKNASYLSLTIQFFSSGAHAIQEVTLAKDLTHFCHMVHLMYSLFLFVALGATDASIYALTAVTFYYGILMLDGGTSDPGEIILARLAMLYGGAAVGHAFQQIDQFNFAISAASELFPIIDRVGSLAILMLMVNWVGF